jgi:hypothetical protein
VKADNYAESTVDAQFEKAGVIGKVDGDFRASGVTLAKEGLHSALDRFASEARRQILTEHASRTA